MTFVTKTYDFYTALSTQYNNIEIHSTNHINDFQTLVITNQGDFICESFGNHENPNETYMKVYKVQY